MEDDKVKVACCVLYLRVNSPANSQFYKNNAELLDVIGQEIREINSNGYSVTVLGDFNARIEPNQNFTFNSYPHKPNENGLLAVNFAKTSNLFCMNPMTWEGKAAEEYTFQRDLGVRVVKSIIDYGLGCENSISITKSFRVSDAQEDAVESDHSALIWKFNMNNKVSTIPIKIKNPLKFIKRWSSYKIILDKRLAGRWDTFKLMTASEQGDFIKTQMCKVGLSVSPGQNHTKKQEILSSKLNTLLSKKKKVRSSLKRLVDQDSVEYRDLRRQAREIGDKVRKQHFVDSLRRKGRMKKILSSNSPKASKLFWELINKKPKSSSRIEILNQVQFYSFLYLNRISQFIVPLF